MTPKSRYPTVFFKQLDFFHENGDVALYPMFAENRRSGTSGGNFGYVREKGFKTENIVDYTSAEEDGFLGRNSLLLDRANEKAYALCLLELMKTYLLSSVKILIMPVLFEAFHCKRRTKMIYHTNVMMCLGETLR
jgi:hypothetical protein